MLPGLEPNAWAIFLLVALGLDFLLERLSDVLELRALEREPPASVADIYEPDEYARSQAYTRARTRLGIVSSTVSFVALLAFWLVGGFDALDLWLRGLELPWLGSVGAWEGVGGTVGRGLLYLGILGFAGSLLSLPFSVYSTFVLEERFGFNRTTVRTFVLDLLKGFVLGIVLGGPLLAAVLALFAHFDTWAWAFCWAVAVGYGLVVQWLGPKVILPLFNEFEPLEEGELRERVEELAASRGYAFERITVMDASRRSSKANAFFTGFGRTKRLTLFDTLVERLTPREAAAVVAHEMGHDERGHVLQRLAVSIVHQGAVLFLLSVVLEQAGLYAAFGMTHTPLYAGFVFFGLLLTPVERVLSIVLNAWSRHHEYEADRTAVEATGDPKALASGLREITADSLGNLTPHPVNVVLHHGHPPLHRRLAALGETGDREGAGGENR